MISGYILKVLMTSFSHLFTSFTCFYLIYSFQTDIDTQSFLQTSLRFLFIVREYLTYLYYK